MPSSRAVRRRPIVQTMRTPVRRWQTLVIINQLILDHQKEYGNWSATIRYITVAIIVRKLFKDANAENYSLSDKFIFTVPMIILDEIDKLLKFSSEVINPLLHFCLMNTARGNPTASSLILLFELWLVHAAISRLRNNEVYRFVLYRMRQSRYQKIYTTMNKYNGPNARSNKVLFLWNGYSNACCFGSQVDEFEFS
ncbi:hypothetical protein T12_8131 [Trichinella patagoniensis]|uniref:Uncharacterized protein n=1 Tax=Trichinella patagoniensis TaxID=990121 RepID=A0A0V0ZJ49_9BILA|nr:hypothetical protein T12_8131 [Trichinella patagoniensis]